MFGFKTFKQWARPKILQNERDFDDLANDLDLEADRIDELEDRLLLLETGGNSEGGSGDSEGDNVEDDTEPGDGSGTLVIPDFIFTKRGVFQSIHDISQEGIDMNNFALEFVINPLNLAGIMHGTIFSFYNSEGSFYPDARFNGGRLQMAIFGELGNTDIQRMGLINMFIAHDKDKTGGFVAGDKNQFSEIRSHRAIDWKTEHRIRLEVKRLAFEKVAMTVDVDGQQVYRNHEHDFYYNPAPMLVFGAKYYRSQFANIPGAKLSQIQIRNL